MKSGFKTKCAAVGAAMLLGSAGAEAATSITIYAGPGPAYPVIGNVGPAARVDIFGCDATWHWCDVNYNGARGWVPAGNLWGTWHRHRANIAEYGPPTGIPVIVFEQRGYWDHYYRDRPFYNNQTYWHGHDRNDWHGRRGRWND